MKKFLFIFFLLCGSSGLLLHAQTPFYVSGRTVVKIGLRDTLMVMGSLINDNPASRLNVHNAGHLYLTGDLEDRKSGLFRSSSFGNGSLNDDSYSESLMSSFGHIYFAGNKPQRIRAAKDTAIWLADVHVLNAVTLDADIRVIGNLELHDSLNLNGHSVFHYVYDDFNYVGKWGKLSNETNTSFIYDSRTGEAGAIKMLKTNSNGEFRDLQTMGLTVTSTNAIAQLAVSRYHKQDMGVTSGTIRKYFDIEKSNYLYTTDPMGIRYFARDFNPAEMSEDGFSLFEIRTDSSLPKARRLQSELDMGRHYVSSSDSITYLPGRRYSVAPTRCPSPPVVDLGADTVLCRGSVLLLQVPAAEYLPATYEWRRNNAIIKTGNSTRVCEASEAGTYHVRVTDSRGCSSIDSTHVRVASTPQPVVRTSHLRRCESAPFTFSCSGISGVSVAGLQWDFGDGTSGTDLVCTKNYKPVCGNYTVYLTAFSPEGCSARDSIRIEVEQRKQPQIRKELRHLVGSFTAIDTLRGCGNDVAIATWYVNGDSVATGMHLNNYVFPAYGDYSIGLRMNGTLCETYTQDTVHAKSPGAARFTFAAPDKQDYCVGEQVKLINTSEVNSGAFIYSWDYGNGRRSQDSLPLVAAYSSAGTYAVTLTMESTTIQGWQSTYTAIIRIHDNPQINFGGAVFHCKAQYTLQPEEVQPYYAYEWKSGETALGSSQSLTATSDGIYLLTVTNTIYGCRASEQVQLTLNRYLQPQLGANRAACGSLKLDAHNPNATYLWSTGATTREITVTQSGAYHVYVRDAEGCEGRDTVTVTIHENPNASLGDDVFLCSNETLAIQAPANAAGAVFRWSTGVGADHIVVKSAGMYSVTVTHANGICAVSDTIQVFEKQAPVIRFDGSYRICNNQFIILNQYDHYAAELIRWTYPDGKTATAPEIATNQSGVHQVYVRYSNGCSASGSVNVSKGATNAVVNFMVSSKANTNDVLQMVNLSYPEPLAYLWEVENTLFSTEENPLLTLYQSAAWMVKDTFQIRLTATDGACPVSKTKQIIVLPEGALAVKDHDTGETTVIHSGSPGEPSVETTTNYIELLDAVLFPNPTRTGQFTVVVNLTSPALVQVVVFNMSGRIMDKKVVNAAGASQQIQMSTAGYQSGFYLVHVSAGKKTRLLKVVVGK